MAAAPSEASQTQRFSTFWRRDGGRSLSDLTLFGIMAPEVSQPVGVTVTFIRGVLFDSCFPRHGAQRIEESTTVGVFGAVCLNRARCVQSDGPRPTPLGVESVRAISELQLGEGEAGWGWVSQGEAT